MERIVGRDILKRHVGGGYDVTRCDLGNGHFEYRMAPIVTWSHAGVLSDQAYADRLEQVRLHEEDTEAQAERKEANLERAAKRATRRVRHLCKAAGVDTLLTMTYRENMTCWQTLKRHVKEFNRRMTKLIPGWFYVAAYERQERGAWHVHMAVHRLPRELSRRDGVKLKSFNVVRAVWRAVTGELGGNIDVQSRKRNSQRAPSKIAAYLSKYMTKAFADGDEWSNRFSSSKGISIPKPERIRFAGYSFGDVATVIFDDLPPYFSEQLQWGLNRWKDALFWTLDLNLKRRETSGAYDDLSTA